MGLLFQQIKKDLKKYSKIFEQKDRLSQSKASKVSLIPQSEGCAATSAITAKAGLRGAAVCVLRVASAPKTLVLFPPRRDAVGNWGWHGDLELVTSLLPCGSGAALGGK